MAANPDAATHCIALQKAGDGFGKVENGGIHPILCAPERPRHVGVTHDQSRVDIGDVTARTKRFVARTVDHQHRHVVVFRPNGQGSRDGLYHLKRQRIQRLWPVQRDPPDTVDFPNVNVAHLVSALAIQNNGAPVRHLRCSYRVIFKEMNGTAARITNLINRA